MKVELCGFSGYKIYPGHGRRLCQDRREGFPVSSCKMRVGIPLQEEPSADKRDCALQKKTQQGTVGRNSKEKNLRCSQIPEAIARASLADIMAKRSQKPDVRKAQREQAIRAAKEAKKAKQASKKTAMAPKQKVVEPVKVSAPRVGGKC